MAEETTQSTDTGTSTPTEPVANAGTQMDSSSAAKLQGASSQGGIPDGGSQSSQDEGKPGAEADKAKPPKEPAADAGDKKVIDLDPNEKKWLESKNLSLDGLDVSSEAVRTLIKNARNAESKMNEAINKAKAQEVADAARNVPNPAATKEERKTELDLFEERFEATLDNALFVNGVQSIEELAKVNPDAARNLDSIYMRERQKAWEAEKDAQERIKAEAKKVEQDKVRFKTEMDNAERQMNENLISLKAKEPEVEAHMKNSGADAVLQKIEADAAWPKAFVLSNPEMLSWFAKASKAITMMNDMPKLEEKWRADYEKQLADQATAKLTPADAGGADTTKSRMASRVQQIAANRRF